MIAQEKLRGRAREDMVRHILGMLESFLESFPLLSFVRGESFTTDHWAGLFRMLNFNPKGAETKIRY